MSINSQDGFSLIDIVIMLTFVVVLSSVGLYQTRLMFFGAGLQQTASTLKDTIENYRDLAQTTNREIRLRFDSKTDIVWADIPYNGLASVNPVSIPGTGSPKLPPNRWYVAFQLGAKKTHNGIAGTVLTGRTEITAASFGSLTEEPDTAILRPSGTVTPGRVTISNGNRDCSIRLSLRGLITSECPTQS